MLVSHTSREHCNHKPASHLKAAVSSSWLVVPFCFHMTGQIFTDPENTNSSAPKCWLEHLLKLYVQDYALD